MYVISLKKRRTSHESGNGKEKNLTCTPGQGQVSQNGGKTMRSGLGWRSLDPVEAVAAVHEIENKDTLLRIAYEARNPEARRLAVLKIGDKELMASFAKHDISPIVRRRLVRELDDIELVRYIRQNDSDWSVRDSALGRLKTLEEE